MQLKDKEMSFSKKSYDSKEKFNKISRASKLCNISIKDVNSKLTKKKNKSGNSKPVLLSLPSRITKSNLLLIVSKFLKTKE